MKRVPAFGSFRATLDDDVIDQQAFECPTPDPNINLDAVLLDVGAGGEEQSAARNGADLSRLAALVSRCQSGASPVSTHVRPSTPFLKLRLASSVACAASHIRAISAQVNQPTG